MRLIDADILYPDSVSIKGDRLCISQSQIANAPTVDVLDKIRAEIDRQQKWLLQAGYAACNVDIVLEAIKAVAERSDKK